MPRIGLDREIPVVNAALALAGLLYLIFRLFGGRFN